MTDPKLRIARIERGFHRLSLFAAVATFAFFCVSALVEIIDGRWSDADLLNTVIIIPVLTAAAFLFARGLGWVVLGFLHHEHH